MLHTKATIHIREDAGRYLIRISGPAACEVKESFKAAFPQHGSRTWRQTEGVWSVGSRTRLDTWLSYLRGVTVDWPETDAARRTA